MAIKDLMAGLGVQPGVMKPYADGGAVDNPDTDKVKSEAGDKDKSDNGAKAPKEDKTAQPGPSELTKGNEEDRKDAGKTYPRANSRKNVESGDLAKVGTHGSIKRRDGIVKSPEGVIQNPYSGLAEGGHADPGGAEEGGVQGIDADSVIDAFLEENPDLVETPIEEWPEDAIELLKDALNSDTVDEPNGVLPEEEDEKGKPIEESPVEIAEEPTTDVDNPAQDFDIAELAKLTQAGDKDGAWDMLQNMFGIGPTPDKEEKGATNALDRMVASDRNVKRPTNHLAKVIGGLKF